MINKCRICGGKINLIHKGTRDRKDIDVFKCIDCKTKQLSCFGENDYEHGFMNEKYGMTQEEILSRLEECSIDDDRRANMMDPLVGGKRVLDFGCGFGGFLNRIKPRALEVGGVELGTDERRWLKDINIPCCKTIDEVNKKYDYITMFHVFEHLTDPDIWLKKISTLLDKEGKLIIEVPNGNDALLELYKSEDFADFTYWSAHLFLYTIEGFMILFDRSSEFSKIKVDQIQRYPLANHLYWLSHKKPGGQKKWNIFDDIDLSESYIRCLKKFNLCDTLLFTLEK